MSERICFLSHKHSTYFKPKRVGCFSFSEMIFSFNFNEAKKKLNERVQVGQFQCQFIYNQLLFSYLKLTLPSSKVWIHF